MEFGRVIEAGPGLAGRVKQVLINFNKLLQGCSIAERNISQVLQLVDGCSPATRCDNSAFLLLLSNGCHGLSMATLEIGCSKGNDPVGDHEVSGTGAALEGAGRVLELLAILLNRCSEDCLVAQSIDDLVRVEAVSWLIFKSCQDFEDVSSGLDHLEKVVWEVDRLKTEYSNHGYEGIMVTEKGNLQVDTTELMYCGKHLLETYASLLDPVLTDTAHERLRVWFCVHWGRLGESFETLGRYEECIPWFEAALTVAELTRSDIESPLIADSNFNLGRALHEAARLCHDYEAKEKLTLRSVTFLTKSIDLFADRTESDPVGITADRWRLGSYVDAPSLSNLANVAAKSCHTDEKGYPVLASTPDDRVEKVTRFYRQNLEAALRDGGLDSIRFASARFSEILQLRWQMLWKLPDFDNRELYLSIVPIARLQELNPDVDGVPSWNIHRARAECYLGCDYFRHSEVEKAIQTMERGLSTLQDEPELGDEMSRFLSAEIHTGLGCIHLFSGNSHAAATNFQKSAQLHISPGMRMMNCIVAGNVWMSCYNYVAALKLTKELLESGIPSENWKERALLIEYKATIENMKGDLEESVLSLKEARKFYHKQQPLDRVDLAWINVKLLRTYYQMPDKYKTHWESSNLVHECDEPIMKKFHDGTEVWREWQMLKASLSFFVEDYAGGDGEIEQVTYNPDDSSESNSRYSLLMGLAEYCNSTGEFDTAMEQYKEMEEIIKKGPYEQTTARIDVMRAGTLLLEGTKASVERACELCEKAEHWLRQNDLGCLAEALTVHAQALITLKLEQLDVDEHHAEVVFKLIDEANECCEARGNRPRLASLACIRAIVYSNAKDFVQAEAAGRKSALLWAEVQLQLQSHLESAWVASLERDMKQLFLLMQNVAAAMRDCKMALLWAERGRTRLFTHLTTQVAAALIFKEAALHSTERGHDGGNTRGSKFARGLLEAYLESSEKLQELPVESQGEAGIGSSSSQGKTTNSRNTYSQEDVASLEGRIRIDNLWFDRFDDRALELLNKAVEKCGPDTLIVEYTYDDSMAQDNPVVHIYLINHHIRANLRLYLTEAFAILPSNLALNGNCKSSFYLKRMEYKTWERKWGPGKTLATLIMKTREAIVRKDSDAIQGLSLLHSLLIEPVQEYVDRFPKLILAVHENLALVPFAALYNKQSGKFLVQEKTISYVPSIRVLHQCFCRQRDFQLAMRRGLLEPPFVAGNPEPMGLGLGPLPHASEEAKLVAQTLGVQPCIGADMNKEVVKNALSNASLVLLATHGVVDSDFPHGALVLQARPRPSSSVLCFPSLDSPLEAVNETRLRISNTANLKKDAHALEQVLTSNEIASLPGGIRGGLVVLSACRSGQGEVTSEGLLGLGRYVLQAGAPTAILALWEVADSSTKLLIAGVFEQMVREGKDAAEALRQVMLRMMQEKEYSIFHWASLVVYGSPFLRYGPASSDLMLDDLGLSAHECALLSGAFQAIPGLEKVIDWPPKENLAQGNLVPCTCKGCLKGVKGAVVQ